MYFWWLLIFSLLLVQHIYTQNAVEYNVDENKPPETLGNIINGANLKLPNQGIFFTILPINNGYNKFFSVDTNGNFKTVSEIDRDSICPKVEVCKINLDVQVNPTEYFEIVKVGVVINDVNDESPTFDKPLYVISVSEAILVGTLVTLPTANDFDSPQNGIISYETGDLDSSVFKFIPIGQDNSEPKLETLKLLDRELIPSYQFLIFARDGANPAHSGSTLIRIELSDVNDSPPVFKRSLYEITVDENKPVNDSILQLTAVDNDTGTNAQVYYYLSTVSPATYSNMFTIDERTGILRIGDVLDFETIKEVTLTVKARNKEITSPFSETRVIVRVRDVNDEPPAIKINTKPKAGGLTILENATLSTFVAHITVQDPDSDNGGQFTCNLTNPTTGSFSLVQIHATDFKIITKKLFDRENKAKYTVTIQCEDKGTPKLSSTKNVTITIGDVNDNTPEFDNTTYKVVISENDDAPGQTLLTVRARDNDVDNNGRIRYGVVFTNPTSAIALKHVKLNEIRGEITVVKPFDYEDKKVLSFNISATDYGTSNKSSQCKVTINVVDRDDEGPVFKQSVYDMKVSENNEINYFVGQVVAEDNDSNMYNGITYWFLSLFRNDSGDGSSLMETDGIFTINSQSGAIHINASLDREKISNYTFSVMALGPGPLFHNSTCVVYVTVEDINDNTPQIIFPNSINYTVSLPITLRENDKVARILATDIDANMNSLLSYHIVSGDDNGLFEIDTNTGDLVTTRDYTAPLNYKVELLILVTDNGIPKKSNNTFLQIEFNLDAPDGELVTISNKNADIVIAIGVLSGILVVALLTAIVCLLKRKQKPKHTHMKTVSETVPYNQVKLTLDTSSMNQDSTDVYQLTGNTEEKPELVKMESPSPPFDQGFYNKGLEMSDIDDLILQGVNLDELQQYDDSNIPVASGGQSKDSSSEGSNADSGRGSHEETTSLPGLGSLQRWDNVPLALGISPKREADANKMKSLDGPHADPEGRRLHVSQSFRSDSTVPPELPPRNRRSQSFRTFNDSQEPPPPTPPPRLYTNKSRPPHPTHLPPYRHFDDNFYKLPNIHSNNGNFDNIQYDNPRFLFPESVPNLVQDIRLNSAPSHFNNEEFVDFVEYPQYRSSHGAMYINSRNNGAYNTNNYSNDGMMLLENDNVFAIGAEVGNRIPPRTIKYCSQV